MCGDQEGDDYGFRTLSDIILYMERGISVIMKDMNHVYTALYDLFNQNFAVSGSQRFCRIALGTQFNPRCLVHELFHVLVFLNNDQQTLEGTDAPFFNRFEKHLLDLECMLTPEQRSALSMTEGWIEKLMTGPKRKANMDVKLAKSQVFPLYHQDYLKMLLILQGTNLTTTECVTHCKTELLKTASEDVLLLSHESDLDGREKTFIVTTWTSLHTEDLRSFVIRFIPSQSSKALIFTYDTEILNPEKQFPFQINYKHFSSYKTDQELIQHLSDFFRSETNQIFMLDCQMSKVSRHIGMIKFSCEKVLNEFPNSGKKICVLIRMRRNVQCEPIVCWFGDWETIMVKSEKRATYPIPDVVTSTKDLLVGESMVKLNSISSEMIFDIFQLFKYKVTKSNYTAEDIGDHIAWISENIDKDLALQSALARKVVKLIEAEASELESWSQQVLCDLKCINGNTDLYSCIESFLKSVLTQKFAQVFFAIERKFGFRSYFISSEKTLKDIWLSVLETLSCKFSISQLQQGNTLPFNLRYDFPFIIMEFDTVARLYSQYQVQEVISREEQNIDIGKQQRKAATERFYNDFMNESVCCSRYTEMRQAMTLQQLYIRNIIRIDLPDNLSQFEEVLLQMHWTLSSKSNTFEAKIFSYMENKSFCLVLCEIMDICVSLEINCVPVLQGKLSQLSEEEKDSSNRDEQRENSERINNMEPQIFAKTCKSELTQVIEQIYLEGIIQVLTHLEQSAELRKLAAGLHMLFEALLQLDEDCEISTIEFWKNIVSLVDTKPEYLEGLKTIASKAVGDYLYDESYIDCVLQICETWSADSEVLAFRSFYFLLMLQGNSYHLRYIVNKINTSAESWKYSGVFFDFMVDDISNGDVLQLNVLEDSELVNELESILESESITCPFAVLLSDSICKRIKPNFWTDVEKAQENYKIFDFWKERVAICYDEPQKVTQMRAIAVVRAYLEIYCCQIVSDPIFNPAVQRIEGNITNFLSGDFPQVSLWRVFCLKLLYQSQNSSIDALHQLIQRRSTITWLKSSDLPEEIHVNVQPSTPEQQWFLDVKEQFQLLMKSEEHSLNRLIEEISSEESKVSFALAVMETVFVNSRRQPNQTVAQNWIRSRYAELQSKLGKELCQLVRFFAYNFPESSIFKITQQTSEKELNEILFLCHLLIIFLAHKNQSSPVTSLFFDGSGNVHTRLPEIFNSMYVYGVGGKPLYLHLEHVRTNFQSLKSLHHPSYSKGSANKCSCDYVYFISKCGGPTIISQCPYCGSDIGGLKHIWVEREGHLNLTDDEALAFLDSALEKYAANPERGLWTFEASIYNEIGSRRLPLAMSHFLHLFLHVSVYYFSEAEIIDRNFLASIINTNQGLYDITQYFKNAIQEDLKQLMESLKTEDIHLFWYHIMTLLPALLKSHPEVPNCSAARDKFEQDFSKCIFPLIENRQAIINEVKKQRYHHPLLQEISTNQTDFPLLPLLRIRRRGEFSELKFHLDLHPHKSKYPLLDYYLQHQSELALLRVLNSLVQLTNYLLREYSQITSRNEARSLKMKDIMKKDTRLSTLFKAFTDMWNQHSLPELQYECHTLPPRKFTEDDELICFLVDNQEDGGGMQLAAALIHLADIQNRMMRVFLESRQALTAQYAFDKSQYPVQQISSAAVISLNLDDDAFHRRYMNNPEYGMGTEVVYCFFRLEEMIAKALSKAKLLNSESLVYMQYKFEMLACTSQNSNLISDVCSKIDQQVLEKDEIQSLYNWLQRKGTESMDGFKLYMSKLYTALGLLLCHIPNVRVNPNLSIQHFAQSIGQKSLDVILDPISIFHLSLSKIVSAFEVIEEYYFPYMEEFSTAILTSGTRGYKRS